MDKLADKGKMNTLRHAKSPSSIIGARGSLDKPDPHAARKWFDDWEKRTGEKKEESRDSSLRAEEAKLGLPSVKHMHTGKPKGQLEELKVGFDEGITRLGQTAAGVGALVNFPGSETRRRLYKERADIMSKYRKRSNESNTGISGGDIVSGAIGLVPEVINPFNKPTKIAKIGNAAYHAARSYAPDKSVVDAAIGSAANIAGEKVEDLVTYGKGLVGNVVGNVLEKTAGYLKPEDD